MGGQLYMSINETTIGVSIVTESFTSECMSSSRLQLIISIKIQSLTFWYIFFQWSIFEICAIKHLNLEINFKQFKKSMLHFFQL